jgi:hypothetical protein
VATREKADLLADLDVVDDSLDFNALPMDEAFSSRPAEQCALPRLLGRCDLLVSCFAAGDEVAMARLAQLAGADESLYLPIRLEVESAEGINLIPVDYFVAAFTAILEDSLEGGIFHIVNARQTTMGDLIDYTRRLFHIRGIEPCRPEDFGARPRNALEILFSNYLEAYGPYMRDKRTFAMDNARGILAKRGITCPEFDFEVFSRCMNYAVEVDWGARLYGGT